jgi:hypothetical protein
MRATILAWSTVSGLVVGLVVGVLVFAVLVLAGEVASNVIPRMSGRVRGVASFITLVILPIAGAMLGWLEGRLKLE